MSLETLQVVGPIFVLFHCLMRCLNAKPFVYSNSRREKKDQFKGERASLCHSEVLLQKLEVWVEQKQVCDAIEGTASLCEKGRKTTPNLLQLHCRLWHIWTRGHTEWEKARQNWLLRYLFFSLCFQYNVLWTKRRWGKGKDGKIPVCTPFGAGPLWLFVHLYCRCPDDLKLESLMNFFLFLLQPGQHPAAFLTLICCLTI